MNHVIVSNNSIPITGQVVTLLGYPQLFCSLDFIRVSHRISLFDIMAYTTNDIHINLHGPWRFVHIEWNEMAYNGNILWSLGSLFSRKYLKWIAILNSTSCAYSLFTTLKWSQFVYIHTVVACCIFCFLCFVNIFFIVIYIDVYIFSRSLDVDPHGWWYNWVYMHCLCTLPFSFSWPY